jgi:adenylate kinase family enzyme
MPYRDTSVLRQGACSHDATPRPNAGALLCEGIADGSIAMTISFRRVLVVGPAASGKTTLARELSSISGLPHIELDILRYQRDWKEVSTADFRDHVAAVTEGDSWIIDGNYSAVRVLTWNRADLVVWLDYSLPVTLRRLLVRTFRRLATAANVGNENREKLNRLFGRHSIIAWAIRSHSPLRREYEIMIAESRPNGPYIVRHRSPRATRIWLAKLANTASYELGNITEGKGGLSWKTES